ncbi:MAG: ABC transporter substrate-binding protein [Anaeromyxobacteraceae bacterium]
MNFRWVSAFVVLAGALTTPAAAADVIKIGLTAEMTGPNAEAGAYQVNGAQLALDEINKAGGVNGMQLELKVEDTQSSNNGAVNALSHLGSEGNVTAIVGPVRSTQIQAMAPTLKKMGVPMLIGGTDPGLTRAGNTWLFRCRPNDSYSAKVIAEFGVNTLGKKKWAIVHATDAFGTGGKNALVDALKPLGAQAALVQGFTSNTQDFTPVILAIKQSGADIIGTYIPNSPDVGIFSKQLRQLGVNAPWVGSPSVATATAMKLGQDALFGTYGIADFTPGANAEAEAYAKKYRERFKVEPDFYSSWAYDAVHLIANAAKSAGSTKPDDLKKAFQSVKGWKGAEGTYQFDKYGDGLHGYNVVKNEQGKITFVKTITFPPPE